jgi:hypothetical protein
MPNNKHRDCGGRGITTAMRGGVYFLKHARLGSDGKPDGDAEFEFHATETEGVICWAIQNAAIVDTISTVEDIFQVMRPERRSAQAQSAARTGFRRPIAPTRNYFTWRLPQSVIFPPTRSNNIVPGTTVWEASRSPTRSRDQRVRLQLLTSLQELRNGSSSTSAIPTVEHFQPRAESSLRANQMVILSLSMRAPDETFGTCNWALPSPLPPPPISQTTSNTSSFRQARHFSPSAHLILKLRRRQLNFVREDYRFAFETNPQFQ